jgi:cell division protein FtsB
LKITYRIHESSASVPQHNKNDNVFFLQRLFALLAQRQRISAAGASDMADELTTLSAKIKRTEEKVEKLEQHIETITTGDDAAVEALVKKLRFRDGDAALEDLRAEKARLEKLLLRYLDEKARLQQSGVGTSMLPVRQELVMFPCQSSCCVHQQTS